MPKDGEACFIARYSRLLIKQTWNREWRVGSPVVLHGYERFTKDLDLIVILEDRNLAKLFDILRKIGYNPTGSR